MALLSKPSSAARTSLIYITLGAITIIWTGIWFAWLREHPPESHGVFYICAGFMLTGVTLLVIGLAVGQIGRSARHAELPPPEVTSAIAQADQNVAARAPIVAPVNPAAPVAVPGGQAVAPTPSVAPVPAVPLAPGARPAVSPTLKR